MMAGGRENGFLMKTIEHTADVALRLLSMRLRVPNDFIAWN
jgi:hypothetical protein